MIIKNRCWLVVTQINLKIARAIIKFNLEKNIKFFLLNWSGYSPVGDLSRNGGAADKQFKPIICKVEFIN